METSHQDAKGSAVVKEMAVNVLGFVISNFITLGFSGLMTEAQWRFPLGIQLIFCAVILVMVPILPESPRWLLARKRDEDARHVLALLNDGDSEEESGSTVRREEDASAVAGGECVLDAIATATVQRDAGGVTPPAVRFPRTCQSLNLLPAFLEPFRS